MKPFWAELRSATPEKTHAYQSPNKQYFQQIVGEGVLIRHDRELFSGWRYKGDESKRGAAQMVRW